MFHRTQAVTSDGNYLAICTCGWTDLPRLTWPNAMRDVAYHLHTAGVHPYACIYCADEALGIPVSETRR